MAKEGAQIIKLLQGTDLKDVNHSLQTYLAPLLGNSGSRLENAKNDHRAFAKEYLPFLTQLLKISGVRLATAASANDHAAQKMADELFAATATAIDGLNVLRSQLAGSSFEIELQRYGFVRRLMNWKRYSSALAQSRLLFRSLCQITASPGSRTNARTKASSAKNSRKESSSRAAVSSGSDRRFSEDFVLSPPSTSGTAAELLTLVVAATIDLVWCMTESLEDSNCFGVAATVPEQLAPWISLLDPVAAIKQQAALFKSFYKCSSILLTRPSKVEADLVQKFCSLTLNLCATSQCDQYIKVARKFCSSLSCQGPESCRKGVELCTVAIGEILSNIKLRGAWTSNEFSDLVEWFGRACQTGNWVELGWSQICKVVHHVRKVSPTAPVVITGLYAIGLVLVRVDEVKIDREIGGIGSKVDSHDLESAMKPAWLPEVKDFYIDASELLHATEKLLTVLLDLDQTCSSNRTIGNSSMDSTSQNTRESIQRGEVSEVSRKTLVSFVRTLHYLQKPFTRYAQAMWSASGGKLLVVEVAPRLFHSGLRKVLQIVDPVVKMGMRCNGLNEYEQDILTKGSQLSSQALLTALRLSLLFHDGIQEIFELVIKMIDVLQTTEEQWWFMSSTYNMGVQSFNNKQYNLACWPFSLANKAAWARVELSCLESKLGTSLNDIIAEASAKCLALVDAHNRNEEPSKSRLVLVDALMQWVKAKAGSPCVAVPHALVKAFVKLNCAEKQVHGEIRSLYDYLCGVQIVPHPKAMGLLLEEEHAVCEALGNTYPDICLKLKEKITEQLLGEVYIGRSFVLERSRALMKKCRALRLCEARNVSDCFKIISDAVASLEVALENREQRSDQKLLDCPRLKRQLATAYSMKAVCSYEMNPCSEEFIHTSILSLHAWKSMLALNEKNRTSFELEANFTTDAYEQDGIVLLLYLNDLLAVQGYTVLALEVQDVTLKVIKHSKELTEDWVELWMNGQKGHLLCALPFSSSFLSSIRQSFDAAASPNEFWERYFERFPGSLLESHYHSVRNDLRDEAPKDSRLAANRREALNQLKVVIGARLSDSNGQKSSLFTLRTAELCHLASELAFSNGDTLEALKYAKEAFQLRSRLFKFIFSGLEKRSSDTNGLVLDTSTADGQKVLQLRRQFGGSTIFSWPFSGKAQNFLTYPSQWRILGDYIESLTQIGVIYECMGAVDDAERRFREGHRLAMAQNLQLALVSFSVNLGELNRKKQLWENAEKYFAEATQTLDRLQIQRSCEACIRTGKALLQLRIGDFLRQCCSSQEKDVLKNKVGVVLTSYTDAAAFLTPLLKHSVGQFDLEEERTFVMSHAVHSTVLRSLQKKGKALCSEIMSYDLGETQISQKTTKSRSRKTGQTRSSRAKLTGAEKELAALCDGMSKTSFSSTASTTDVNHEQRKSEKTSCKTGLRSKVSKELPISQYDVLTAEEAVNYRKNSSSAAIQIDVHKSSLTETGREDLSEANQPYSSLIEEWPACKLDKMSRKLLGRVLTQRGKCLDRLGEPGKAMEIFKQAMHVLNVPCLAQPTNSDVGESTFPMEEGALLYHVTRLCLRWKQGCDELRYASGPADVKNSDVNKSKLRSISQLCRAFSLCQQVPLLMQKIAKLLAILHVPSTYEGPQYLSLAEMANAAAYFHQASLGMVTRQQHLALLNSKLEDRQVHNHHIRTCFQRMREALRTAQVDMENVGTYATEFWDRMPRSSACCISFVSKDDMEIVEGNSLLSNGDSNGVADGLLVTRLSFESKPVVLLLPILPIFDGPENSLRGSKPGNFLSDPYNLSSDEDDDCTSSERNEGLPSEVELGKKKQTLLERVAGEFGLILEESRLSTSGTYPVSTVEEKSVWWKWRMELDVRLSKMLRLVEDCWLGPFKCLLLGEVEASMSKSFELCTGFLVEFMSSITDPGMSAIDQGLTNLLLQAAGSLTAPQLERIVAGMLLGFREYSFCKVHSNDCGVDCRNFSEKLDEGRYQQIKKVSDSFLAAYKISTQESGYAALKAFADDKCGKRRPRRHVKGRGGSNSLSVPDAILRMSSDGSNSSEVPVKRRPLQLILDSDTQALPWESLPMLRDQEVYRMPSLGTIHAVYIQRHCYIPSDVGVALSAQFSESLRMEEVTSEALSMPTEPPATDVRSDACLDLTCVNPYNTYYILNPNGDLPSTQAAFESWFTHQPGWKGKAGIIPTAEEYQMGLQNHDLFVYLGHGSGDQFLPERYVRELNHCAASLLMGCSSGRLSFRGDYPPVGVVLSYLMAGCPAVIANLWDVTDGDIDRFSRFLLHSWLGSRIESGICESEKETGDMDDSNVPLRVCQSNRVGLGRTRMHGVVNSEKQKEKIATRQTAFEDMHRLGSAVGQSRNACRLPHLIGASPVCYGVPTGVSKQIFAETSP